MNTPEASTFVDFTPVNTGNEKYMPHDCIAYILRKDSRFDVVEAAEAGEDQPLWTVRYQAQPEPELDANKVAIVEAAVFENHTYIKYTVQHLTHTNLVASATATSILELLWGSTRLAYRYPYPRISVQAEWLVVEAALPNRMAPVCLDFMARVARAHQEYLFEAHLEFIAEDHRAAMDVIMRL